MNQSESKRQARRGEYKKAGQFKVTEFPNPSGETSWRVTGYRLNGSRVRENFKDQGAAIGRRQALEIAEQNIQTAAKTVLTSLSQDQINEAERCITDLNGKALSKAVRFFLENYQEPVRSMTVSDAYKQFLTAKKKEGCRDDTIRNLRSRVGYLAKEIGGKLVSEVLPTHVGDLVSRGGADRDRTTKDNDRRAFSSFFSWCMDPEQGFCTSNPAHKVGRTRRNNGDESEPAIFTLAEARRLMESAETFQGGKLVPYVALGLFAGIRPRELSRLDWDAINLDRGTITIGAKIAKMRSKRIIHMATLRAEDKDHKEIELPANLAEWLAPHAANRAPIKGANWRKDFDALKRLAGWGGRAGIDESQTKDHAVKLKPWVEDIMRHTAISNYLALVHDEGKAAEWAGNSPNIIHKHYRALVGDGAEKVFWNIRPGEASAKVVPLMTAEVAA